MNTIALYTSCLLFLFTLCACPSGKQLPQDQSETTPGPTSILVTLAPGQDPSALISHFAEYQLKNHGPTSRTENKYLLRSSDPVQNLQKLLSEISEFPGVEHAEFVLTNSKDQQ